MRNPKHINFLITDGIIKEDQYDVNMKYHTRLKQLSCWRYEKQLNIKHINKLKGSGCFVVTSKEKESV